MYAPTPARLLQNESMDIPILEMHRAGNMTLENAFKLPITSFGEAERALVWLQIAECLQLCMLNGIAVDDVFNPANTMITWHEGVEPQMKMIDCALWKLNMDVKTATDKNIHEFVSLVVNVQYDSCPSQHECVTCRLKTMLCPDECTFDLKHISSLFNRDPMLTMLNACCVGKFPTTTLQLLYRINQNTHWIVAGRLVTLIENML